MSLSLFFSSILPKAISTGLSRLIPCHESFHPTTRVGGLTLVGGILFLSVLATPSLGRCDSGETISDSEISQLIEGLASDSYATRIRCRDRLMRIGLAAFDQLREARNHPDNEVAIVARRLTSGLRVQWSSPGDSTRARELLSEYGSHSVLERRKRIESLGELPQADAFEPLLRLARFEAEAVLARAAAIALIRLDVQHENKLFWNPAANAADSKPIDSKPIDIEARNRSHAAQIESMLGQQDRISSQWLLQYAADLRSGELQTQAWSQIVQGNRQQLGPDGTSSNSETEVSTAELLDLVWSIAERAASQGEEEAATRLVVDNVDLIPSRTRDLIETASWALDHSLYQSVVAMHDAHSALYRKSPILLYSAAEAMTQIGRDTDANRLAEIAIEINPLPKPEQEPKLAMPMHPQTIENHADAHNEIAKELAERGLFQWAEREYRLVIDRLPIDNTNASLARMSLATLFGEMLQHNDVIELLSPLTQRIERDDEFRDRLIARRFAYTIVQSDMDYHRGMLMIEQGDVDAAKPVLRRAFELNKINIDILIAMYPLEGDTQWTASVKKTLDEQSAFAQSKVKDARNLMLQAGPFRQSGRTLSSALNTYAWLVSNTEGDAEKALRYSEESLKLTPGNYALMDTCARCHYAVGDIEAAIAMQVEACQQMPHSPPLQRQLAEFRESLRQSQSETE